MASTNKTTHYELSQYIGTDKPTYLGDYNSDMSKIDTALYDVDTKADSLETITSGLGDRVDTLETTTATHTSEISAINSSLNGLTPIGVVLPFTGGNIPDKWLLCDGSPISRTDYADLYDVIGVTYGIGDGATTFNIPNLSGKIPVGYEISDSDFNTLGATGGAKTHTLTINEMPEHQHYGLTYTGDSSKPISMNQGGVSTGYHLTFQLNSVSGATDIVTNARGGNQPHNNLQPYIVLKYIIKAQN